MGTLQYIESLFGTEVLSRILQIPEHCNVLEALNSISLAVNHQCSKRVLWKVFVNLPNIRKMWGFSDECEVVIDSLPEMCIEILYKIVFLSRKHLNWAFEALGMKDFKIKLDELILKYLSVADFLKSVKSLLHLENIDDPYRVKEFSRTFYGRWSSPSMTAVCLLLEKCGMRDPPAEAFMKKFN